MNVISCKEAKALNLKHYFTGKPCKRGHIAVRYVTVQHCLECNRLHVARDYLLHKDLRDAAHKTLRGLVIKAYSGMKSRVEGRGPVAGRHLYTGLGIMPKEEFVAWATADAVYRALHAAWVKSAYERKLSPSIDRIDTQRGYVRGNVQWLTLSDNSRKAQMWKYHGINQITKEAA